MARVRLAERALAQDERLVVRDPVGEPMMSGRHVGGDGLLRFENLTMEREWTVSIPVG
jgi:hypothetical protein